MQTKRLGRTGIQVSELCFGTMSFGGDADEAESARMYAACRDAGVDFFDCANVYSAGRAEEILGRLMAHERDELVITSKTGSAFGSGPRGRGGSRYQVVRSVEASLRRLGTDRIDVLFMHRFDDDTPLEETLHALEHLVAAGKVLALGCSNYAAWQVMKAVGISARQGWTGFSVIQPMYNLVKRQAEVELLPLAASEDLAVIPYNPLGAGLLTGKYMAAGAQGRLALDASYAKRYGPEWMGESAARFVEWARGRGLDPVTVAVAWVAAHPAVTCPILGARNAEQLGASLAAAGFAMSPEMRAEIAALSPAPAPATDRLDDL